MQLLFLCQREVCHNLIGHSVVMDCIALPFRTLIGEPAMFLTSAFGGLVLVLMAGTEDIWVAYAGYAVFRALYQMMITVARLLK